ncbi:MAG: plasmid stabilization system [Flavobacteriaceae bacterium CG_4_8_14_3_um_filter_34_10]|nr:type II toxin-antitoxin system RelE/ParE family toxin [Flavobacteriia bacterium]OIP51218.1 MAG: plasmid stabilization system [Flavobacteriaceae bacterium CG2_30_34_30]PIQ17417.1 MAG: plasmid stabilization system [Flavobacteriaceae bacterium CG18_big_fil_WC_8_21_14_2_50_34_36]PIV50657.1 MAG: plasmid stabilization system [Flavobacteriaceae bacterium CG02_land_8_20_14_3_00_34_13]PIX09653.1 MAG: plasmid stabilization system [Flavobacteriaceae bacterium CG_4_8_14_3_um_filter_34_10]PIZ08723.1 MAG
MAKKQIIWSKRANTELVNVLEFFNERNGNTYYSAKILNEVEDILKVLSENELMGRLTSDRRSRVVVMEVYLIFYEVMDSKIEILSFWDNRQNNKKRIDSKD